VTDRRRGAVLLVARDPAVRRRYQACLAGVGDVIACGPDAPHAPRAPDAVATVLCVASQDLEACPRLARPIDAPLVLVACDLDEAGLVRALAELEPAQLLVDPAPLAALRWALARASAAGSGSAREQHRPARALLGVSSTIREILGQIEKVAPTRATVLILGETGTGKELVARALHTGSPRAGRPFVAVNCAALPESLLEAELFGFRRGAFTSANRDHDGILAQADGGTLFLDEIGDMPASLQAKLLRVLESGELRALGGEATRSVDLRVVSATHRDLEVAVQQGSFREDLLYRINTVVLHVPPLRRRRVDIPFLAQHFAEELGAERARQITLGEDFLDALAQRDFPGNVRELRNAVEHAIAIAEPGRDLSVADLPDTGAPLPLLGNATLRDRIEQLELQALHSALERCGGNRSRAAVALGLTRYGLRKKMRRLGLA
jgi:DNA-binding NtrC family response regulator